MAVFEQKFKQVQAVVEKAIQQPDDLKAEQAAEKAFAELRIAWKTLSDTEKKELTPKLKGLSLKYKNRKPEQPAKVAATASNQTLNLVFEKNEEPVDTLGDVLAHMQPINVPRRYFTGKPSAKSLLKWFNYAGFREGQEEAIDAALNGQDTLVIMPTGGGKSLCYQLPGLATSDLTIVVSPLIALMYDQYQRLANEGHPTAMLASGTSEEFSEIMLKQIYDGSARIIFVSPERFGSKRFMDALKRRKVDLFVIDEAHCLSDWGNDFRPDYLRLPKVIKELNRPTVMAATATATPEVARDIVKKLEMNDPVLVLGGFDRPNITWDVIPLSGTGSMEKKYQLLLRAVKMDENLPAVIYCGTRKDVDEVARRLQSDGVKALGYHAGMSPQARHYAQGKFTSGEVPVLAATNAFGLGISIDDIRTVFHYALPTSIEAYYQEAGRAGRDGMPAKAVLFSMRADLGRLINFNKRRTMTPEVVQQQLMQLRKVAVKGKTVIEAPTEDLQRMAIAVAEQVEAISLSPATNGKIEIEFVGALDYKKTYAACQVAKDRGWAAYTAIERFSSSSNECHRRQILEHFGDGSDPKPTVRCCSVCEAPTWLGDIDNLEVPSKGKKKIIQATNGSGGADPELLVKLKDWRAKTAGNKPAYTVCTNSAIDQLAIVKPTTAKELAALHGIGPKFVERYSDEVLEIIKQS